MIKYVNEREFLFDKTKQELTIKTNDNSVIITNNEIHYEKFHLSESICNEEQLVFGSCQSSMVKFTVSNVFESIKGKWITITSKINDKPTPFQYGVYKVYQDKLSADRKSREIVAYDALFDILESDVAEWYNTILPTNESTITLEEFRHSLISHFGLEEQEIVLCNDEMIVSKTIEPQQLSAGDVLFAICQINGCFGNIARNGKFRYVVLEGNTQTLYASEKLLASEKLIIGSGEPYKVYNGSYKAPKTIFANNNIFSSDTLFAKSEIEKDIAGLFYKNCTYEDFVSNKIEKVQLRKEENDIGAIVGNGANTYIVENNFLLYGKDNEELNIIANNLYNAIKEISYVPFTCDLKANPCLEVGDAIHIYTNDKIVRSYVLHRELSKIQYPSDSLNANGKEEYVENLNLANKSIIELKGKGNLLTRTLDETRSYIYDTEQRLSSEILQQAGEIALRVRKDQIISEINLTPEHITISANKIDLVGIVNSDTFIANLINAEQLNAKFATIENLSAVNANFDNLNASNLKVGTVSTSRLDLDGILQGFASMTIQGVTIVGRDVKGSQYYIYDATTSSYEPLYEQSVTIDGVSYKLLGRRV